MFLSGFFVILQWVNWFDMQMAIKLVTRNGKNVELWVLCILYGAVVGDSENESNTNTMQQRIGLAS